MVLYTSGYTTQSIKNMAGQEGFEPPTFGFGDRRSAVGTTGLEHLFRENVKKTLKVWDAYIIRVPCFMQALRA